jgi:regulator of protease activity HflC (stomatin/prohibitin superfamily)
MPIPAQKIITQDKVTLMWLVAYFKVVDAYRAVVEIENYNRAVNQYHNHRRSVVDLSP